MVKFFVLIVFSFLILEEEICSLRIFAYCSCELVNTFFLDSWLRVLFPLNFLLACLCDHFLNRKNRIYLPLILGPEVCNKSVVIWQFGAVRMLCSGHWEMEMLLLGMQRTLILWSYAPWFCHPASSCITAKSHLSHAVTLAGNWES